MRKLLLVLVVLAAALALPGQARAIGQCGLPSAQPWWIDHGALELEPVFAKPGVITGVSTGTLPHRLRTAGAKTVYWDMYLNNRVGTPFQPRTLDYAVDRANRLFEFAAAQSGCDKPLIALNELFGAHLETPWTQTNTRYRENVLAFLKTLAERGARPFLLISTTPYTASEDAAAWWREAARYADLVPEVYFGAPSVYAQGPIVGSRRLRAGMRDKLARFLAIGIPASKLGIVLGFQTGRGAGGREGLQPREAWFEVVKWQALAARQISREYGIGSIWSWGWGTYSASAVDPDKRDAACVYLWTRSPTLCDGPSVAGPRFDVSLTEGQIRVPAGRKCTFGRRGISNTQLAALGQLTGDREVAFTALLARLSESPYGPVKSARVLAAERAVISLRFGGSRSAYLAALVQAGANVAIARGVLADELRRFDLSRTMRARKPSAREISTFYYSYADLPTRLVEAKPGPWWLGGKTRGLAIGGVAPEHVLRLAEGRVRTVRLLEGSVKVKPLGETQPLGSVPLEQARGAISAALRAFARRAAFESWTLLRQESLLRTAICTRDELPTPGTIRLSSYLPFLSLD
ncbi:MAG: hypothetical protein M3168_06540 [Actinomycetota bacterium]|nr:hypothetical protein [Actinomycetota bacterium]